MNPSDLKNLLFDLLRLDVRLGSGDGQLRYDCPDGTMTPELTERLRCHKLKLLALLDGLVPGADGLCGVNQIVDWSVPLVAAAYPKNLLVLDFETYYAIDCSLRQMDVASYIHDPRFMIHGLAVRHPDGSSEFLTDITAAKKQLQALYGDGLEKATVTCHNAVFDCGILLWKLGIRPKFILDTLGLSRAYFCGADSNDLASVAKRLGLQPKGDALRDLLGLRALNPQQKAALRGYALNDADLCYQLAVRLLPKLSRPEFELRIMRHTLDLVLSPRLCFDIGRAPSVLETMNTAEEAALANAGIDASTAASNKEFEARLTSVLRSVGESVPTKQGKRGDIPALAKTDDGLHRLLNHADARVANLVRARAVVKSMPSHRQRLEKMARLARCFNGKMPVFLNYSMAVTGRFSGGGGVNVQNLPARGDGPGSLLRGLIVPDAGYSLVISDAAQIEARILATLAGQQDLVEAFKQGRDVYCEFASQVFGQTVRKPLPEDTPETSQRLKMQRHIGKTAVLGLGYSMGHETFFKRLEQEDALREEISSGRIDLDFCHSIVRTFRRAYSCIPALWRQYEAAFRAAMQGSTIDVRGVSFGYSDGAVVVGLPSGRNLFYHDVSLESDREIVHGRGSLYGGKLAENIVQAVARDVLCEAILSLESQGFPVVLHVHDEVVLHVPIEQVPQAEAAAEKALSTAPAWLPGLPLAAEVKTGGSYAK